MKPKLTVIFVSFLLALPIANATVSSRYAQQSAEWLRSEEGCRIADNVVTWQSSHGSWPKNCDTASRPYEGEKDKLDGTFDNGATTGELRFLARAFRATNEPRYKQAFLKGLDHILEAQYPTGGWPQFFPPSRGYPRHITFNDNSMVRILAFLRDVSESSDYAFLETDRRAAAAKAVVRGIECVLKCQIVHEGQRLAWCAQHDEKTFKPRPARSYELASVSGSESVGIVRFLMSFDDPSPKIITAIESAVRWFDAAKITGIRQTSKPAPGTEKGRDKTIVTDPTARPIWARFYQIGTNKPIFCSRDGIARDNLADISYERRNGYSWYTSGPADLLSKAYPAWAKRHTPGRNILAPSAR